jgi:hypothetical protein
LFFTATAVAFPEELEFYGHQGSEDEPLAKAPATHNRIEKEAKGERGPSDFMGGGRASSGEIFCLGKARRGTYRKRH